MSNYKRWTFGEVTGVEVLEKALRARREREEAIAFYATNTKSIQKKTSLANFDVMTSMKITRGYLFRLLVVANSPEFIHEMILNNTIAPDTVVNIHFYLKKKLKRPYTEEELTNTYKDLLDVASYYKKTKIFPLLAEKYFQVGRCLDSPKYADIAEIVEI